MLTPRPDAEWSTTANKARLLEVYRDFDPSLVALLNKAEAESLKVWELLDMDVLPTWVEGRLALLGDAAHPFLPRKFAPEKTKNWLPVFSCVCSVLMILKTDRPGARRRLRDGGRRVLVHRPPARDAARRSA
jgi:hypothetical protein